MATDPSATELSASRPPASAPGATPPVAPRRPHRLEAHGDVRVDDWYWLRDRDDPEVLAYLEAENAAADELLAPLAHFRQLLFEEIKARVVETDADAPVRIGPWWYWSRSVEGLQYSIFCRRADPARQLDAVDVLAEARSGRGEETVILDENVLAGDSEYFALGVWDVSFDHAVLAYATDLDGSERYDLRFRDLASGEDLPDVIAGVSYGSAWAADNRTFFYVRPDEAMRPFQIWRHTLGQAAEDDVLVHEDLDERDFVSVGVTRSQRFVLIESASKMAGESYWIDASRPTDAPRLVLGKVEGVEYDVDHAVWPGEGDVWMIRTNQPDPDGSPATDFALYRMPVGGTGTDLRAVMAHRPGVKLDSVDCFAGHLVLNERADGLEQLRVLYPGTDRQELIGQPEPVYSLLHGSNPEWETATYRFGYTSLVTPVSVIEHELASGERRVLRTQPVRGYDAARFRTERVWAEAADGVRVPISLVARADTPLDGSAPCLLYGYGAYEINIDPTFSTLRLNLLERGVVFAIAHVRGGGELGRRWYEQGRLEHKPNTFSDFIACAEHLIATGWAAPDRIAIRGGSAGGLLMGAVTNMRPDLWRVVVAEVPFVDVVTTMSDESLPLTVTEWEEWGNPVTDPDAYRTMRSYSPYDNVVAGGHPAMYVTGGLNDPRVGFWEPAKWVAKLRALRTDDRALVLRIETGAGHQGLSGRYDVWTDEARVQAFVLDQLGIEA
jgi:oligopeptidase B